MGKSRIIGRNDEKQQAGCASLSVFSTNINFWVAGSARVKNMA